MFFISEFTKIRRQPQRQGTNMTIQILSETERVHISKELFKLITLVKAIPGILKRRLENMRIEVGVGILKDI